MESFRAEAVMPEILLGLISRAKLPGRAFGLKRFLRVPVPAVSAVERVPLEVWRIDHHRISRPDAIT